MICIFSKTGKHFIENDKFFSSQSNVFFLCYPSFKMLVFALKWGNLNKGKRIQKKYNKIENSGEHWTGIGEKNDEQMRKKESHWLIPPLPPRLPPLRLLKNEYFFNVSLESNQLRRPFKNLDNKNKLNPIGWDWSSCGKTISHAESLPFSSLYLFEPMNFTIEIGLSFFFNFFSDLPHQQLAQLEPRLVPVLALALAQGLVPENELMKGSRRTTLIECNLYNFIGFNLWIFAKNLRKMDKEFRDHFFTIPFIVSVFSNFKFQHLYYPQKIILWKGFPQF